jgi:ribonucleoside-triphosphate reductase
MKDPVDRVVISFTQVRAAGVRLKGYGWISSGDETISAAFQKICAILNKRAGQLLTRMDILDILNHMGTTLSSRRSAEIAVMEDGSPELMDFILAKKDFWLHGNEHRQHPPSSPAQPAVVARRTLRLGVLHQEGRDRPDAEHSAERGVDPSRTEPIAQRPARLSDPAASTQAPAARL